MDFLNKKESDEWFKLNCAPSIEERCPYRLSFLIPNDTGRKTVLGHYLINFLNENKKKEGLFWITSYSIWPNNENLHMFLMYRKAMGETRDLFESPGHLFRGLDFEDLECFVQFSLYFFWDALLISSSCNVAFKLSHDEYLDSYFDNEVLKGRFLEIISKLNLKILDT